MKREKLSPVQAACLAWMKEHPGFTYDKIPFRDPTVTALQRKGYVRGALMLPTVIEEGDR